MSRPLAQAIQIALLGLGLLIAIGIWADRTAGGAETGIASAVCLAGAVGGVANNFRRLQGLSTHNWKDLDATARWLMTIQIYVSPLVGVLFAFVLYVAFMGGILQGSLFPEFATPEFEGMVQFFEKARPLKTVDVAKALFWAFVAGFAEGFVPNFIDKIAKEAPNDAA